MAITKMFRDRVVSMEQTLELGEKYLDLLGELVAEAFPGTGILTHELEAETDLFTIAVGGESGRPRRIKFTRMALSDATCVPAAAVERSAPVRDRLLGALRAQAEKDEILVTFRTVMDDEDRAVGEEVDAEWRRKEEAAAAARRAEEERRAEEKRRQREIDAARHRARREKQRGGGEAKAAVPAQAQPQPGNGSGRKRRRRGRGAQGGPGQQPENVKPQLARPAGPQVPAPQAGSRPHPQHPKPQQPQPPRPPQEGAAPGGAEAAGGGRRRKRRRRRGGGGSGGQKPAGAGDGGGAN
jgi:hypothetical protein